MNAILRQTYEVRNTQPQIANENIRKTILVIRNQVRGRAAENDHSAVGAEGLFLNAAGGVRCRGNDERTRNGGKLNAGAIRCGNNKNIVLKLAVCREQVRGIRRKASDLPVRTQRRKNDIAIYSVGAALVSGQKSSCAALLVISIQLEVLPADWILLQIRSAACKRDQTAIRGNGRGVRKTVGGRRNQFVLAEDRIPQINRTIKTVGEKVPVRAPGGRDEFG